GFSVQEGTLTEWLAVDGASVEAGKPLYTLELDKSVQEIESPASGTLKIHGAVGEIYPIGALIAEIV
ncbi:MAG: biotin/lipoyl-containing protein, partial [Panacagrimonas sp.]